MKNDDLLAEFFRRGESRWGQVLLGLWTALGLSGLMTLAWFEPWSARLLAQATASGASSRLVAWAATPCVMALRAILLVEAFGYFYHRFFQHVGALTRLSAVTRRNQMFHWMHHMILYPIGRFYKRPGPYVSSEKGFAWSWIAPGLVLAGAWLWTRGLSFAMVCFFAAIWLYAKFVIDLTHDRFHLSKHPWLGSRYFQWLEKIHILHHWDQRTNFTIVHPLMDQLFGTYLAPESHKRELNVALEDSALNLSDLLNWSYLLKEATPAERAAFVSNAKRHPRSLRKLDGLVSLLHRRTSAYPQEAQSRELYMKALDLLALVRPAPWSSIPTANS